MKNNKNSWLKIAGIAAAIVGAVVAVTVYIRQKSKCLSEELDFDNSIYFDDDEPLMEDEYSDSYSPKTENDEEPIVESVETEDLEDDEEEMAPEI